MRRTQHLVAQAAVRREHVATRHCNMFCQHKPVVFPFSASLLNTKRFSNGVLKGKVRSAEICICRELLGREDNR